MEKISIIIPVFNSEPFLGKCIDSIIFQSFKNIEILAIDDASTDRSKKILNDYARSDRRLRVYHHDENMGAPSARNLGIQKATGDYIMFVDADDELRKDALSILYQYANLYGAIGLTTEQLCKTKSIYKAKVDSILMVQIKENCPNLLKAPKVIFPPDIKFRNQ